MTADLLAGIPDEDLNDLLERATDRGGYVLASELAGFDDPFDEDVETLSQEVSDLGLTLVDDLPQTAADEPTLDVGFTGDPVRQYLNEAGQYELLDAEQEADLSKRYRAGLAARDLLPEAAGATHPRLRRIAREGERAKERLIRANLRLVVPTAKKYAGADLPMIEAIQEGNLGLIRAVEKFDHTKGYKFSTYAVWWIRQAIQRGLSRRGRTIRVPSTIWEQSGKVRKTEQRLRTSLGRDPSREEVSEATGLSVDRIEEIGDALRPLTSLDRPVGEDGDIALGDLLADPDSNDPASDSAVSDVRARITEALAKLPERERIIVELRYGLDHGEPRTLEQIGQVVGLTRERVRQLEKAALVKLRDPAAAHGLDSVFSALATAA